MVSFFAKIRLLWHAFFDRRFPLWTKLLVLGGLLYGLSPLDLVPDLLPLLGQLDDIGVLITVFTVFYRAAAKLGTKKTKR